MTGVIESLTPHGVKLQDGTELQADLVVQGLGYDKPHSYLSPALFKSLKIGEDGVHLYRNMLSPCVPVRSRCQLRFPQREELAGRGAPDSFQVASVITP